MGDSISRVCGYVDMHGTRCASYGIRHVKYYGYLCANHQTMAKSDISGTPQQEAVHHPQHYRGDTVYEAIKVIEAWELNFSLGSALKYICRNGKKPNAEQVEDLKKARWYLDREIQRLETGK